MVIIHAMNGFHTRAIDQSLRSRLDVMPAVVVTGARQTGKSTLAHALNTRRYHTMDDLDALDMAEKDPDRLLAGDAPITIDEVQRVPKLLHAIKRHIDGNRRLGQFLLAGSANLLLMRQVAESLAGRASYLTLWPMTRREQLGIASCGLWDLLIESEDAAWLDLLQREAAIRNLKEWRAFAKTGGFPVPALHMHDQTERDIWFEGYVRTYLERDLLSLSTVASLPDFRRLMRAVCLGVGGLVNQTNLGRGLGLPQATVNRYLNLLETSYMLVRIPAYSDNRGKRLIKTPKMYWSDTGLALHLSGTEPDGATLENLVLMDLLAWRDSSKARCEIYHWRSHSGLEVDFVIESGNGRLLPIEIKSTERPRLRDSVNLRAFRDQYGEQARFGLLLHDGDSVFWLTPDVLAAPWWRVL